MRVQIFTTGDYWNQASRIRGYYLGEYLSRNGFIVNVYPYTAIRRSFMKRAIHLFDDFLFKVSTIVHSKRDKPVIYIQRGICSVPLISLMFVIGSKYIFRRKVIYDLDDGLFLFNPFEINSILKVSDVVVVGGHELMRHAEKINPSTMFAPTSANLTIYREIKRKKEAKDEKILGFVGCPATTPHLAMLLNPLERLARRYDYTLKIVSTRTKEDYKRFDWLLTKFKNAKIRFETIPYSVEKEPELISELDIGLAPLYSGIFEKYKCGFKVINYMASGIPPVASNYGEHKHIITNGYNGFLCDNKEDWFVKLSVLIEDDERRRVMGENARKTAENKYSLENNIKKLMSVINGLHDG